VGGQISREDGPNPENMLPILKRRFSPRLEADRARTELDHRQARREVERLWLIFWLVGAREGGRDEGGKTEWE
jgi:hypothetical protein